MVSFAMPSSKSTFSGKDEQKDSMPINVQLRAVLEEDLPVFFEHQQDPVAAEMAAFPSRQRDAFMAHWAKIMQDDTVVLRTILFDGQVAGNVVSFMRSGKREVGYWIGREYWGKGIATKALAAFLKEVRMRPLYGVIARHNAGSRRVLEKCGFRLVNEARTSGEPGEVEMEELILDSP